MADRLDAAREGAWRRYLKARRHDGATLYDLNASGADAAGFGVPRLAYFLTGGRFPPQSLLVRAASLVQGATKDELDSCWPGELSAASMTEFLKKLEVKILLRRVYEKCVPGGVTEPELKDERTEAKKEAKKVVPEPKKFFSDALIDPEGFVKGGKYYVAHVQPDGESKLIKIRVKELYPQDEKCLVDICGELRGGTLLEYAALSECHELLPRDDLYWAGEPLSSDPHRRRVEGMVRQMSLMLHDLRGDARKSMGGDYELAKALLEDYAADKGAGLPWGSTAQSREKACLAREAADREGRRLEAERRQAREEEERAAKEEKQKAKEEKARATAAAKEEKQKAAASKNPRTKKAAPKAQDLENPFAPQEEEEAEEDVPPRKAPKKAAAAKKKRREIDFEEQTAAQESDLRWNLKHRSAKIKPLLALNADGSFVHSDEDLKAVAQRIKAAKLTRDVVETLCLQHPGGLLVAVESRVATFAVVPGSGIELEDVEIEEQENGRKKLRGVVSQLAGKILVSTDAALKKKSLIKILPKPSFKRKYEALVEQHNEQHRAFEEATRALRAAKVPEGVEAQLGPILEMMEGHVDPIYPEAPPVKVGENGQQGILAFCSVTRKPKKRPRREQTPEAQDEAEAEAEAEVADAD